MDLAFRLKYGFGVIPSAQKLDNKWSNLLAKRAELQQLEVSDELKKFSSLKILINSPVFQKERNEIESLNFHGSKEEKLLKEFSILRKSNKIRTYFKLKDSADLDRFTKIRSSAEYGHFISLHKEFQSHDFQKRKAALSKKKFKKTADFTLEKEMKSLAKSDDIRFCNRYGKSKNYLLYHHCIGSKDLAKYDELKKLVESKEFIERIQYIKDKYRYRKSESYQKLQEYNSLDKSKILTDYRRLKKDPELDFFKKWKVVFEDMFLDNKLHEEKWQCGNYWAFVTGGKNFSQDGEKQCYNGVGNLEIKNNTLAICSKKESAHGQLWKPGHGLLAHNFDYTSAIVNSGPLFRFNEGAIEVKARFSMNPSIVSSVSLTGDKPFPQIDLFRSGKRRIGMGIIEKQSGKSHSKYRRLSGLNDSKYHIFRLEIDGDVLVWKINGHKVHQETHFVNEPLFINILTALHGNVKDHLLPHRFEINWVRVFAKK